MEKPVKKFGEAAYVLSLVLCSLGVCLSAKSGLGVSMVVAPTYVLHVYLSKFSPFFTFGTMEYIVQTVVVLAIAIIVGKFKLKYPLAIVTSIIYGLMLDGWRLVFGTQAFSELHLQIIFMALGALITAIAIALSLRSFMPQQGYDMFVYEVAHEKNLNINKVKWAYDIISLTLAIGLMLVLFGKFDLSLIGVGTVVLTIINTPLIAFFGSLLDKVFDFSPAFPKVAEKVFSYKAPK